MGSTDALLVGGVLSVMPFACGARLSRGHVKPFAAGAKAAGCHRLRVIRAHIGPMLIEAGLSPAIPLSPRAET
jgi:hypothetical protein